MISFLTILVVAVLTGLDQLFKYWVDLYLKPVETKMLIPGVLQLHYVENNGAMMGMLQGKTVLLGIFAALLVLALVYVIFSKKIQSRILYCAFVAVLSGGLGNIIDRFFRGFVIDYIEVLFVRFYVFNFADSLITVGAFTILIYELVMILREQKRKKASGNG